MTDTLPFYQVDAFADAPFKGNQACVMPLAGGFLPDETLQAIAAENNVAETAFLVQTGPASWDLRWFTPAMEVPLCGHATLASAHVLYHHLGASADTLAFDTRRSGRLSVARLSDGRLEMDFPAPNVSEIAVTDDVATALGAHPRKAWAGPFYAALFDTPEEITALDPDLAALKALGPSGDWSRGNFGCMAPGGEAGADVTSRFFAPGSGIPEDPATGSWHTMVAAIMCPRLNKPRLDCVQAYPGRGARLSVGLRDDRVALAGQAVTVIEGRFAL